MTCKARHLRKRELRKREIEAEKEAHARRAIARVTSSIERVAVSRHVERVMAFDAVDLYNTYLITPRPSQPRLVVVLPTQVPSAFYRNAPSMPMQKAEFEWVPYGLNHHFEDGRTMAFRWWNLECVSHPAEDKGARIARLEARWQEAMGLRSTRDPDPFVEMHRLRAENAALRAMAGVSSRVQTTFPVPHERRYL